MSVHPEMKETDIAPAELAEWMSRNGELQVVDVREPYEREAGHIAATTHIPLVELSARAGEIDRERAVVFYCRVGARSDMAAQAFRASGYKALSMEGGLMRWAREGLPLSPQGGSVAEH
ncbi:MAG TPA: rhodanese-like domain-containing protein [Solirubrobacteraceae bacterium]|nr:rhodanese-like domain-containing protein [Solirubrobacteraceae bacterium]